jgi:ribosome biogenesis GTPase A
MEQYWDQIKQIVHESDIVLEILDARAVDLSRNEQLEKIIAAAGRPRVYVLNKCDLVAKKELEFVVRKLFDERKVSEDSVVFFSNRRKVSVRNLLTKIKQIFAKYGKRPGFEGETPILEKPYREAKADIVIGVVGYPNVGKSSVINALAFKKKAPVSSKAGTTHGIHWISTGKSNEIKLIDTPGVIPLTSQDETRLGIIAARGAEKIKNPEVVAGKILEMFIEDKKMDRFENFYKVKIKPENREDINGILDQLAIEKHHLMKGGVPDVVRTCVRIIKDWQEGKLRLK